MRKKLWTKEKLDIVLGFQGLRVDTFCKMKKDELDLLYKAGSRYFNFGLETGSPRILKLIAKETTVEQAYSTNKILTRYPEIYPHYNFMTGFPTETKEEMLMTVKMMTRLKKENPNVQIISMFLFIPWPETEIYDLTIKHGFIPPKSLEEWGSIQWGLMVSDKFSRFHPWLNKEFIELYKKILFTIHLSNYSNIDKISNFFLRTIANLYAPIAKFRFNHTWYSIMPEYISAKQIETIMRDFERQ